MPNMKQLQRNIMTAIMVAMILLYATSFILFVNTAKEEKQYTELVGEKILIEKDTVTIVEYSLFKGNSTTNTGLQIDRKLCKTKVINE